MSKVIFITFESGTEVFWKEEKFKIGRKKFFEIIEEKLGLSNVKDNFEPIFAIDSAGFLKLKNGDLLPMPMVEKFLSDYEINNTIVIIDKCEEEEINQKVKSFISKHKNFYNLEVIAENHHK